jgi:hypothetical protein
MGSPIKEPFLKGPSMGPLKKGSVQGWRVGIGVVFWLPLGEAPPPTRVAHVTSTEKCARGLWWPSSSDDEPQLDSAPALPCSLGAVDTLVDGSGQNCEADVTEAADTTPNFLLELTNCEADVTVAADTPYDSLVALTDYEADAAEAADTTHHTAVQALDCELIENRSQPGDSSTNLIKWKNRCLTPYEQQNELNIKETLARLKKEQAVATTTDEPSHLSQSSASQPTASVSVDFMSDAGFWESVRIPIRAARKANSPITVGCLHSFHDAPAPSIDAVFARLAKQVNDLVREVSFFKIGITENPRNRCDQYRAEALSAPPDKVVWETMHIIWASVTSKPWIPISTGAMETRLIDHFTTDDALPYGAGKCLNRRGGGGECPSAGNPHFLYCAVQVYLREGQGRDSQDSELEALIE